VLPPRPAGRGAGHCGKVAHGEGFALEDIATEVQIWHGEDDRSDPVAIARSLERRIPRASVRYLEDGGHLILFSHAAEILAAVAASD
jgi:pimeloyl-ACP methyl ester carboxylesterase